MFLGLILPPKPRVWQAAYCPNNSLTLGSSFHRNGAFGKPHTVLIIVCLFLLQAFPSAQNGWLPGLFLCYFFLPKIVLILYVLQAHPSTWTVDMAVRIPRLRPPLSRRTTSSAHVILAQRISQLEWAQSSRQCTPLRILLPVRKKFKHKENNKTFIIDTLDIVSS
jgi:hypothetical protein